MQTTHRSWPAVLVASFVWLVFIAPLRSARGDDVAQSEPTATSRPVGDVDEMKELQSIQSGIVDGINAYRGKHSLEPLTQDPQLHQAAIDFARYMARTDEYGHQADGRTPSGRAAAAGYEYCVVRENIAYRQDPTEITRSELIDFFVEGWIESPPHRENIRAEFVTQTGVGVATNDGVRFYGVQLFGRPKSRSFQVKITNERESEVVLTVQSEAGNDSVTLPPRAYAKFDRCFPTTVGIEGEADSSRIVRESIELKIAGDGWSEP